MTLQFKDRILETTTTTGTGDITLAGAFSTAYRSFGTVCSVGDTFYYAIVAVDGSGIPTGQWETGLGTYSATNTLTRTTFEDSSTGSPVNFSAGTKQVMLTPTAYAWTHAGNYSYEGFGNLLSLAGMTKLSGASGNLTTTDYTKMHRYVWSASGSNTVQMVYTSAPATPWDFYLRMFIPVTLGNNCSFGIALRNSANGKIGNFNYYDQVGPQVQYQEWTNPTTYSSGPFSTLVTKPTGAVLWQRVNSDGTTLTFYYSRNGIDWITAGTRTISAFLGAVDQIGVGGVPIVANEAVITNMGFTQPI